MEVHSHQTLTRVTLQPSLIIIHPGGRLLLQHCDGSVRFIIRGDGKLIASHCVLTSSFTLEGPAAQVSLSFCLLMSRTPSAYMFTIKPEATAASLRLAFVEVLDVGTPVLCDVGNGTCGVHINLVCYGGACREIVTEARMAVVTSACSGVAFSSDVMFPASGLGIGVIGPRKIGFLKTDGCGNKTSTMTWTA